ncbi:unnamed protein product [Polarella glacialis]|uniref:BRCT domain-containing protein n=1 Tax=Polarella glacialis TaxID=89957 RepID=A0A813IYF8_POLGL|nr:unnamed protein product [Polarella glacialis]
MLLPDVAAAVEAARLISSSEPWTHALAVAASTSIDATLAMSVAVLTVTEARNPPTTAAATANLGTTATTTAATTRPTNTAATTAPAALHLGSTKSLDHIILGASGNMTDCPDADEITETEEEYSDDELTMPLTQILEGFMEQEIKDALGPTKMKLDEQSCHAARQAETYRTVLGETDSDRKRRHPPEPAEGPSAELGSGLLGLSWQQVWPRLEAEGWRLEYGPRGASKQVYYLPKGVNRGAGTKNRVDYFDSQTLVMQHLQASVVDARQQSVPVAKKACLQKRRCLEPSIASFVPHPMKPFLREAQSLNPGSAQCRTKSNQGLRVRKSRPLEGWTVAATGFNTEDAAQLRCLAVRCGANFVDRVISLREQLRRGATTCDGLAVIASRELTTSKVLMALAMGVPPVALSWLQEVARSGVPVSAERHALVLQGSLAPARGWDSALEPLRQGIFGQPGQRLVNVLFRGSDSFQAQWCELILATGARIVTTFDSCCYVLAEATTLRLSYSEARSFFSSGARAVGLEWLKASLVSQSEAPGYDIPLCVESTQDKDDHMKRF